MTDFKQFNVWYYDFFNYNDKREDMHQARIHSNARTRSRGTAR